MKNFVGVRRAQPGVAGLDTTLSFHPILESGQRDKSLMNHHSPSAVQSSMIHVTFLSYSRHWSEKDGALIDTHCGIQWGQIGHQWNLWQPSRDLLLQIHLLSQALHLLSRHHRQWRCIRTRNSGDSESIGTLRTLRTCAFCVGWIDWMHCAFLLLSWKDSLSLYGG